MIQANITIDGMMCGMCEAHIKDSIRKRFPNAKKVTANHLDGTASFQMEEDMPRTMVEKELRDEFKPLGYDLLDLTTEEVQGKKKFFGLFG